MPLRQGFAGQFVDFERPLQPLAKGGVSLDPWRASEHLVQRCAIDRAQALHHLPERGAKLGVDQRDDADDELGQVAEGEAVLAAPQHLFVQAAAWTGASEAATLYAEAFERRFGYPPSGYSDTLPYDALSVLLAAVRQAGKVDTDALVAALEKGSFAGVAGTYRFDASHQAAWGTGVGDLHGTVIQWEKEGGPDRLSPALGTPP